MKIVHHPLNIVHWNQGVMKYGPYSVVNIIFVLLLSALAGCASLFLSVPPSAHHQAAINASAPTGCRRTSPVALGSSTSMTIPADPATAEGSSTRSYILHVPSTYNSQHPDAVVLSFHGYGGHATDMEHSSGFTQLAEQQGFLAVYPQGLLDGKSGKPFWASVGPIDYGIDETLFVSTILDTLQRQFCIDSHRIYVTGFSNGASLTGLFMCRLAGRIAAFAPVSGNFYALPGGCSPGRPIPILDFHGTKDGLLHYAGLPASKNPAWPYPSVPQWLQQWATRDGCTQGPTIFLRQFNVTGEQWSGCQGNATVIHYRIEGGGHTWPPLIHGQSPAEVVWNFFQAHPLP